MSIEETDMLLVRKYLSTLFHEVRLQLNTNKKARMEFVAKRITNKNMLRELQRRLNELNMCVENRERVQTKLSELTMENNMFLVNLNELDKEHRELKDKFVELDNLLFRLSKNTSKVSEESADTI